MKPAAVNGCAHGVGLVHDAFFYADDEEYVEELRRFVGAGLEGGAAVLVAVPEPRLSLLRGALSTFAERVLVADMREVGRNPARILPFIHSFVEAHRGRPVHFVGEPIWPGRSPAEVVEGHRHEALINAAFADSPAHIVCPYGVHGLDPEVIVDAHRTHPMLLQSGSRRTSDAYADPFTVYAAREHPLPEPCGRPVAVPFGDGLASFRRRVDEHALSAGLDRRRREDFVLAANEAAANTLRHAQGRGAARIWRNGRELICELADSGRLEDPFAGRRQPSTDKTSGRGIWMMNQVCDLVEVRSDEDGTIVRLHMSLR